MRQLDIFNKLLWILSEAIMNQNVKGAFLSRYVGLSISLCLSVCLCLSVTVFLSVCLSVSVCLCLYTVSDCLFICLPQCVFVSLFVSVSVSQSLCQSLPPLFPLFFDMFLRTSVDVLLCAGGQAGQGGGLFVGDGFDGGIFKKGGGWWIW